ncbi:MAG TPA: sn-glycerol-3-phosphate ABC transporter ATP-binding protein UgpC [Polyangiaceae bacterium]|jgi:sn-glycerol 3-phosphate transport system ATP-binding protein/multiple sugar transport system ATP-binding protein|nr:sn-glycerol-3-phosphate ABC transporter ATP-binding protein UgpC [Polyangiaceae bacterium]
MQPAEVRKERSTSRPEAEETAERVEKKLRCEARGVHKSFGKTHVLRGVDLTVPEGGFAVLVGSSGCGKSTLLRSLAGLETIDEGSIRLAGRDVTKLPPRDRDVAMVFQSYALYPHLTVRGNLAFGLELRGTPKSEIDARVREVSQMLGLDALLDRLPKQLSGGQRQRVAMGRAIARRPTMFLFDEPLSNLDAALRAEVRVDIRRLHDRLGATTVYVTHDQVEAMTLADTLWVMNQGQVEQSGPPMEVYEKPRTRFVATFLGSPAMNLLEGKLVEKDGALVATGEDITVPVDPARFGTTLTRGRAVTIGVRPHDLAVCREGMTRVTEIVVDVVEALGFETYVHGWARQAGPTIVVRLDSAHVRVGEKLPLAIDASKVHLFDAETGRAL